MIVISDQTAVDFTAEIHRPQERESQKVLYKTQQFYRLVMYVDCIIKIDINLSTVLHSCAYRLWSWHPILAETKTSVGQICRKTDESKISAAPWKPDWKPWGHSWQVNLQALHCTTLWTNAGKQNDWLYLEKLHNIWFYFFLHMNGFPLGTSENTTKISQLFSFPYYNTVDSI